MGAKATPGVRAGRGRQPYPRPERRVYFQRRSHYRLGQSRNAGILAADMGGAMQRQVCGKGA